MAKVILRYDRMLCASVIGISWLSLVTAANAANRFEPRWQPKP
jgi:hypothetical protein